MLIFLFILLGYSQADPDPSFSLCRSSFYQGYVPEQYSSSVGLCKEKRLAISYSPIALTPTWTAYYLDPSEERKDKGGRLDFSLDPDLVSLNVSQASVSASVFSEELSAT